MRYLVRGLEVRSENAAQATDRPAKHLVDLLKAEKDHRNVLDYGCGKLRYTGRLVGSASHSTLVDSEIQLSRIQPLGGEETSIRDLIAKRWPTCRAQTIEQFDADATRYDFALCANVLSAIPDYAARGHAIEAIRDHLAPNGRALFVTQYRDASFTRRIQENRAEPYRQGWLVPDPKRATFYEMIDLNRLQKLLVRHGCRVDSSHVHEKSAYVYVARPRGPYAQTL